jgi:Glycosyl hydrolases family 2, TIM barrel domain/Glycosyl hydrolases family 2/Glycosyl hydrolases family 2, sugar binding domain
LRRDPSDRGMSLGWQRGGFSGVAVSVPNVLSARSFKGSAGMRNYEGSVAWYRTSFRAPRAGLYALDFESANFRADVWVDGHRLGSHRGSYLPFQARATLAAGDHRVVVRIDWRDPAQQAREGFHRTWFNWGGLNGEVDVRPIGESELSNPTVQTTLTPDASAAAQASVKLSVEVHNYGRARTIAPEGTLVHGEQSVPVSFPGVSLGHGQATTVRTSVEVPRPALWSPSSPSLYRLTLAVGAESSYSARVGLRQLTWNAGRMYLNGRRLLLHGATIQQDALGRGDALSAADEDRIVGELEAIGANTARAQHPLDPALLERLDTAGILVWQGIGPVEGAGNWYSSTPRLLAEAEQQARTAASAAALHPSIFAWNLVDEVANNGHDGAEVQYVRSTARWLHAHDPARLVAVDVWGDHPPQHAGQLYSEVDAVAETDYTGWYDHPRDSTAQLKARMRARLAAMRRTFAGKVLLISEFGAESNTLNPPGSPGSYAFQSRLLAAHVAVYAADPKLSGMLIWVLGDYPLNPSFNGGSVHGVLPNVRLIEGLNQKGLFTYGGRSKPVVSVISRLFKALPKG